MSRAPGAGESRWVRLGRRAVTIPGYVLATGAFAALLPPLMAAAAAYDLVRGRRLAATRFVALVALYLVCETLGLAASLVLWAGGAFTAPATRLAWHYALQTLWATTLFTGAARLFALRTEVDGDEAVGRGPLLVFIRHASLADTLLPAVFLTRRHGLRLRYVLKRELLWDPCLDVVGQRLPNLFVRRGSAAGALEAAAVGRLAAGLGPDEGVLIYPEGTRVTETKRARILAGLVQTDPARLARARALRHVLPPRAGGALALLDACPGTDVLVFAHAGLDGAATLGAVWGGALRGRVIRVGFRRVPHAAIPAGRPERMAWLDAEWARLDAWIESRPAGV